MLFVGLFCSSALSASLIVEEGELRGAKNIVIEGERFDVEFSDKTPELVYKKGSEWNFTFKSERSATLAAEALRNILKDTIALENPSIIYGIPKTTQAYLITPFNTLMGGLLDCIALRIDSIERRYSLHSAHMDAILPHKLEMPYVYARWVNKTASATIDSKMKKKATVPKTVTPEPDYGDLPVYCSSEYIQYKRALFCRSVQGKCSQYDVDYYANLFFDCALQHPIYDEQTTKYFINKAYDEIRAILRSRLRQYQK